MRGLCKASLILTVLLLQTLLCPALAQTVFVEGNGSEFGTLDLSTGQFTSVGMTTPSLFGLAFGANGTLYGLDDQGSAHLYNVDTATGATTDLGAISESTVSATTRQDGTLFAINQNVPGLLYTLDPATLIVTDIGNTGIAASGLLAFDASGTLFASDLNSPGNLYRIDTTLGTASLVGDIGFDVITGVFTNSHLYGLTSSNEIVSIDTTTGTGTLLGSYSFPNGNVAITAAVPLVPMPVPEPDVFALMAGSIVCGAVFRFRLRSRRG